MRTAFSTGKLAQIINEMKMQQVKILGISERRWTGSGKLVSEDRTVIYSRGEKHERGVGLLFDKTTEMAIINWEPVSDRIITARLKTRFTNVTIIQVYALGQSIIRQRAICLLCSCVLNSNGSAEIARTGNLFGIAL